MYHMILTCWAAVALLMALIMTTCGDDVQEPTDLSDLTGIWQLSTTMTSNTCGMDDGDSNSESIALIQCGKLSIL